MQLPVRFGMNKAEPARLSRRAPWPPGGQGVGMGVSLGISRAVVRRAAVALGVVALAAAGMLAHAPAAHATGVSCTPGGTVKTWVGPAGGNFNTGANWSPS